MNSKNEIEKTVKTWQVAPRPEARERALRDMLAAQKHWKRVKPNLMGTISWRIIMRNRRTQYGLAAAVLVLGLILWFAPGLSKSGLVFAEVMERVQNCKTLTYQVRMNERVPPMMKVMVIHPYLLRMELLGDRTFASLVPTLSSLDGSILIADTHQGVSLILDPKGKRAAKLRGDNKVLDIYDTFRHFRVRAGFSVSELGSRLIAGKQVRGFRMKKENTNDEILVWIDPETKVPMLMEGNSGQGIRYTITDIVFDAELDKSLFNTNPPKDYMVFEPEPDSRLAHLVSAARMDRILKACRKYVDEHNSQWPDNLTELRQYGLMKETFINPQRPNQEIGYVYVKPSVPPSEKTIVLYETYVAWGDGINVGRADFHIEFIKHEAEFKNRLAR